MVTARLSIVWLAAVLPLPQTRLSSHTAPPALTPGHARRSFTPASCISAASAGLHAAYLHGSSVFLFGCFLWPGLLGKGALVCPRVLSPPHGVRLGTVSPLGNKLEPSDVFCQDLGSLAEWYRRRRCRRERRGERQRRWGEDAAGSPPWGRCPHETPGPALPPHPALLLRSRTSHLHPPSKSPFTAVSQTHV